MWGTAHSGKPTAVVYYGRNSVLADQSGFRSFNRRLKSICRIEIEERDISFCDDLLKSASLLIVGACDELSSDEIAAVCKFVQRGGNVLIMASDKSASEMNALTSVFGVLCDDNCVVRRCFEAETGASHPKEALISDTCVSNELSQYICSTHKSQSAGMDSQSSESVDILYAYGCTLDIASCESERQHMTEALPILSSRDLCYPSQQSVCVLVRALGGGHKTGTVCIVGSTLLFSDKWLSVRRCDNAAVLDTLLEILTLEPAGDGHLEHLVEAVSSEVQSALESDDSVAAMKKPVSEKVICNLEELSKRIQPCLSVGDFELKSVGKADFRDWFQLDNELFTNRHIATVQKAYDKLGVEMRTLSLMKPRWEVPAIELKAAIHAPIFIEPMPPPLELFDLDLELASAKDRIDNFYGKCATSDELSDDSCADFIVGCSEILGVGIGDMKGEKKAKAKASLDKMMRELMEWKLFKPY